MFDEKKFAECFKNKSHDWQQDYSFVYDHAFFKVVKCSKCGKHETVVEEK